MTPRKQKTVAANSELPLAIKGYVIVYKPENELSPTPFYYDRKKAKAAAQHTDWKVVAVTLSPNSRLIAAAPDLLEACKDLLSVHTSDSDTAGAIKRASAAIKKAEGETP